MKKIVRVPSKIILWYAIKMEPSHHLKIQLEMIILLKDGKTRRLESYRKSGLLY